MPTVRNTEPDTGRNDPCPCGSGAKHKRCCLPKQEAQAAAIREARRAHMATGGLPAGARERAVSMMGFLGAIGYFNTSHTQDGSGRRKGRSR